MFSCGIAEESGAGGVSAVPALVCLPQAVKNNDSVDYGGGIYWSGANGTLINCQIKNLLITRLSRGDFAVPSEDGLER